MAHLWLFLTPKARSAIIIYAPIIFHGHRISTLLFRLVLLITYYLKSLSYYLNFKKNALFLPNNLVVSIKLSIFAPL